MINKRALLNWHGRYRLSDVVTAIGPASGRRSRASLRGAAPEALFGGGSRKRRIFAPARGVTDRELSLLSLGPTTELGRLGLALVCVAAATLLRLALGLVAPDLLPFGLYLPGIVIAALLGGGRAGLAATAMSGALAWWLFILPRVDFAARRQELAVNLVSMLAVSAVVVAIAARCGTCSPVCEKRARTWRTGRRVTTPSSVRCQKASLCATPFATRMAGWSTMR